jgi:hypothetical protein
MEENKGLEQASTEAEEAEKQAQANPGLEQINERIATVQEQLAQQQEMNEQLVNTMQSLRQQQVQVPKENVISDESFYDIDPRAYRKEIEDGMEERFARRQASDNAKAIATQTIIAEYPEANIDGSKLQKEILKEFKNMPEAVRSTAEGYEAAAARAARKLKVTPKSLQKEEEVDNDEVIDTATLLGLDTSDPKVIERLKQRNERKNWGRYE